MWEGFVFKVINIICLMVDLMFIFDNVHKILLLKMFTFTENTFRKLYENIYGKFTNIKYFKLIYKHKIAT